MRVRIASPDQQFQLTQISVTYFVFCITMEFLKNFHVYWVIL